MSIGNGSKAEALVGFYEWRYQKKEGVSPSLKKLVITELQAYEDAEAVSDMGDDEVL